MMRKQRSKRVTSRKARGAQTGSSLQSSPRKSSHRFWLVRVIQDGEIRSVGTLAVQAHFTLGHTPGGTSWARKSCEDGRCPNIVYADSLNAVSADSFHFSHKTTYTNVLKDFYKSCAVLSDLPSDILLTNHPEFLTL